MGPLTKKIGKGPEFRLYSTAVKFATGKAETIESLDSHRNI